MNYETDSDSNQSSNTEDDLHSSNSDDQSIQSISSVRNGRFVIPVNYNTLSDSDLSTVSDDDSSQPSSEADTRNGGEYPVEPLERPRGIDGWRRSNLETIHVQWLNDEETFWTSIEDLCCSDQLENLLSSERPNLIALKLVHCEESYENLLEDCTSESLVTLFQLLRQVLLSTFEYHKLLVLKSITSEEFMKRLQGILTEDMSPDVMSSIAEELVHVYRGLFAQSDANVSKQFTSSLSNKFSEFRIRLHNHNLVLQEQKINELLDLMKLGEWRIKNGTLYPYEVLQRKFVENNKVRGEYKSLDHYVRVQYNLLSEDFNESARTGILTLMANANLNSRPRLSNSNARAFLGVTLVNSAGKYGVNQVIEFSDPDTVSMLNRQTSGSKVLIPGSLVFLTTVETPFRKWHWLARVLYTGRSTSDIFRLHVSIVSGNHHFRPHSNLLLVAPTQFFEPSFRAMTVLRCMDGARFPFVRQIVKVSKEVRSPRYLAHNSTVMINNIPVPVNDDSLWPEPESLGLNESQMAGLKHALRNELTMIQGPPGTGKTYLSKKIIQVLLNNKALWRKKDDECGAIMVVAASNHSVDELLKGLLSMGIKVLRIGSRSEEPILDDYNMKTLPKHGPNRVFRDMFKALEIEQTKLLEHLRKQLDTIKEITDNGGLVRFKYFEPMLELNSVLSNYLDANLEKWLIPNVTDAVTPIIESISRIPNTSNRFQFLAIKDINQQIELMKKSGGDTNILSNLVEIVSFFEGRLRTLNHPTKDEEQREMEHLNLQFSYYGVSKIQTLPIEIRWKLYKFWRRELSDNHGKVAADLHKQLKDIQIRTQELFNFRNARRIFQCDAEVLGMTSNAAARLHKMLDCLRPKIVLIEEAAVMLEPLAIASLTNHCEHLILVGDHKQLRPITATERIGKAAMFEYSLFERLIMNQLPHCTLATQYRMRPEIASLIAPSVYADLVNHSSLNDQPHVMGVASNVFFFDHNFVENENPVTRSKKNVDEADICILFAEYLVKQGYSQDKIAILTAYAEQKRLILEGVGQRPQISAVKVVTIDSYQGHENDIILLSTVRCNDRGNIGFLSLENRINVALSRAKIGLYIFGNARTLMGKSMLGMWTSVIGKLKAAGSFGKALPLKCQCHGTVTLVDSAHELRKTIERGCSSSAKKFDRKSLDLEHFQKLKIS